MTMMSIGDIVAHRQVDDLIDVAIHEYSLDYVELSDMFDFFVEHFGDGALPKSYEDALIWVYTYVSEVGLG